MKFIIASNNRHKAAEIKSLLPAEFEILSLEQAGIVKEIPEPHPTLELNAAEKAKTIFGITNENCFGEDTGLEVEALNNEPGVRSARYAEDEPVFSDNVSKLMAALQSHSNRSARFRTVICLILGGKEYFFEGICEGKISETPKGSNGFGYDPVFEPAGTGRTFAEMDLKEKNRYSHRAKAIEKLVTFLKQIR